MSARRAFAALLLAITISAAPSSATAAKKPAAPLAQTLKGEAKASYEAGRLLLEASDFAGALLKFRAAYEQQKDPRLLWNMAVCEKNLRHYRKVRELTERYLLDADAAQLLLPSERMAAHELLETLRGLIGSLRLTVNEAGATVLVDDERMGTTPLPGDVPVDMGKRTITVHKDGFRSFTATREVRGGEPLVLDVTLRPPESTLVIRPEPTSATVFLDGKPVGEGAWKGVLRPGKTVVRVVASDRRPYEIDISLDDGETRELTVKLDREPSSSRWIWILAGAAVVTAGAVGGYFLFRPQDVPPERGTLGEVYLPLERSP